MIRQNVIVVCHNVIANMIWIMFVFCAIAAIVVAAYVGYLMRRDYD